MSDEVTLDHPDVQDHLSRQENDDEVVMADGSVRKLGGNPDNTGDDE